MRDVATTTHEQGDPEGSERTLDGFANRARLLHPSRPLSEIGLTSLKQATWEHQRAAMAAGYNSLLEMAVDELMERLLDLQARFDALESQLDRSPLSRALRQR